MDKQASVSVLALKWKNTSVYCESFQPMTLAGSVMQEYPLHSPLLLVVVPVALVSSLTSMFRVLLKPLGQVTFVSQMLAGIVLGPSFFGNSNYLNEKLFSRKAVMVLNVFEAVGLIFTVFLLSVRVDVSVIKKSGRLAIIIGLGTFIFPFVITVGAAHIVRVVMNLDTDLYNTLPLIASIESSTSFHSILSLLTDLKLLNSEMGRLAISSSLISCLSSWFLLAVGAHLRDGSQTGVKHGWLFMNLCIAVTVIITVFAFRPIMFWMMKQTPEGKPLKESHVLTINIMVLGIALFGEVTGQHCFLGPAILGMVTPLNSPFGPYLAEKIELFVWAVFMPCYIVNVGRLINLYSTQYNSFLAVECIILISSTVKTIAIMIPSLYYKMPFADALSLSLLLNCRGIFDVQFYTRGYRLQMVNEESFGILVTHATLGSAIIAPIVRAIYDSSRRYVAYRRRTIQHIGRHSELRILACIHQPEHVTTIINILEASNSPQCPLAVYVMNLEDLARHTLPLVQTHRLDRLPSSKSTKADQMINAFRHYQQKGRGRIYVQCFTAIAPYTTMHDEICLMAFEKSTSLVIVPFQATSGPFTNTVIKNVLKVAPCSVGVLFDRGIFMDPRSILSRQLIINVCMVFIGGPDDREALAYGVRMVENQNIMLTIIRLSAMKHIATDLTEEDNDFNMLNAVRANTIHCKNVAYMEKYVTEGHETAKLLNVIGNEFDLILVGRRHHSDAPVLVGLSEWSEIEELGVIGDLLVSPDFKGPSSILVIQQQASFVEEMIGCGSPKHNSKLNEINIGLV
ncbi:hypothetical protein JRO89_XS12G0076100 [Xanthoceras sorbifolium]|uniref:Cation/H+ exchanger domain-containing protein n=1 Tax=Xanthoceras sorbifolium TaxID=99658 RepID=A0ABQ8HBN6_9ROSI|nr:hypothetical protein JRO89_XS12G0076100 [Xanthoceras sorbifolium]